MCGEDTGEVRSTPQLQQGPVLSPANVTKAPTKKEWPGKQRFPPRADPVEEGGNKAL